MSVPDLIGIEIVNKERVELDNIRHLIMTNYQRGPLFTKTPLSELKEMNVFDLVVNCLNDFKEQA